MKKHPIKHTGCIIRSDNAFKMYKSAVDSGEIVDKRIGDEKVVYSQKEHWYLNLIVLRQRKSI